MYKIFITLVVIQLFGCKKKDECLPPRLEVSTSEAVFTGETISFSVISEAGATFIWTGPNGFTSTEMEPVINSAELTAAGDYTVKARNGTCETTQTVTINVFDSPSCTPTNNTITLLKTMNFSTISFGKNIDGRYELSGGGIDGNFTIGFYNDPVAQGSAIYHFSTGDKNTNNVAMQIDIGGVASNWQALNGDLLVQIVNGKPVATFCNADLSNLQTSAEKNATGKIIVP